MKYIAFCLLIISILSSCSSLKEEYTLTSVMLNSFKKPFDLAEMDSIDLVQDSFQLYGFFLEEYRNQKSDAANGIRRSHGTFEWYDSTNQWVLNNDDVLYMNKVLKNQKPIRWDVSKIKSKFKNIQTIPLPKFNTHAEIEAERIRRIKIGHYAYNVSTPLFNEKKNIAIMAYNLPLMDGSRQILIYQRVGGKWSVVGYYN